MKQYLKIIWLLFFFLIVSCARSEQDFTKEDATLSDESEVRFSLTSSNTMMTKSQYQESDLKAIHNVWVLAVADDGFWRAKCYTESDLTTDGASVTCPSMNFKVGSSVTFYVTANMGDLTDAATPGGVATPSGIEYIIPASVDFSASGMPMAAEPLTKTVTANTSVSVLLEPLLARLNITIDKNGITNNTVADVLASGAIKVKHANRRLCPFGVSSAYSPEHMFSVVVDTENFSSSVSYDMTHPNVVLYVPENSMGNLLGPGSYTQWDKGNQGAPGKQYATYIEYTGHKNAADDGIGGDLSYRAYLGENETSNYSVNRNTTYNCTLGLTWNGLFYTGDWRVDNSDITDSRRLYLSTTANASSASFDWGRLRRNVASQLYVNFSRDGGASWVHSAKDIDGWPYGWDLYIDGVKQAAGTSATAAGDLGWSYVGDPSRDQLFITPGPSSVASSVHTLQVKSADGRVVSNEVTFEVSQPLRLYWSNDADKYVAQMPFLAVGDKEDNNATITYTINDSSTGLELYTPSKYGVYVKTLAAGDYTITAAASNGQTGEITFTVNNPLVDQLWTSQMLWVDGTESERMFRYTTLDGTEMTKAEHVDYEGIGTKFSPSLYETLLKPRIASVVRGSSDYNSNIENLITISDECKLYVHTLKCTVAGNEVKVDSHLNYPIKVNVQAGVETVSYNTYFKDPFADVTNTSFSETFHDFTSMYAHISTTMRNTYGQSKNHSLGSGTGKKLYADASNVLIQAAPTIETRRTALTGTYTNGSSYVSIGLGAEGIYHPSGVNDVYIHVQNTYDKAAGGDRAAYCLSKKIGTATIYLHVAWATIVKPRNYTGEYDIKVTNSGHYKKEHANDTWDYRFLGGGFLNHYSVQWNGEVSNLTVSDFYTTLLSDGTGFYYSMPDYILTNPYGFVGYRFTRNSDDIAYGLGFAIMKTFSGNGHDTSTWSDWRTSNTRSPFCRYNSAFTNWTGTGSWNGLTGYYYVSDTHNDDLKDGSGNGYVVVHFLQDLPVSPNNGYVE